MTFGVISFHLVHEHLVTAARRPGRVRRGDGRRGRRVARHRLRLRPRRRRHPAACCPVVVARGAGAGRSPTAPASRSPASCSGARRPGCRTPRSRRWSPTSCPTAGWPRRTARSRRSRRWRRSSAACLAGWLYDVHRSALVARDRRRAGGRAGAAGRRAGPQATRPRAAAAPPTRVRSMSATPSSYSITMRLHTAPDHGVVGAVATAIAAAGGIVTAIDVADSSHDRLVVDVTCSAADADHAEVLVDAVSAGRGRRGAQGQRPHLPAAHRRQDRGQLEGPAAHPRRPVDGLHPGRRPGQHGAGQQPRGRLAADHQGQLASRSSPTARPCSASATSGPARRCR